MVTVRSVDAIKEITPFWASKFAAITSDPEARSLLLSELKWDAKTLEEATQLTALQFFKHFPLAGFLVERTKIDQLSRLPCVEHIHEFPDDYGLNYLRIVQRLHYVVEHNEGERISVVNMSLQAPDSYLFEEKEAMNVATRILTERGIVVVVAAGNFGPANNTLNRWSVAPWVIGVGASYADGKRLWERSSRGIPHDPLYHPTVVAPGVDVIGWRAPECIYPAVDAEGKYAVASGTSFATPQVSGIAARCWEFIDVLEKSDAVVEWKRIVESQLGLSTRPLTGSPEVVKRMIEDMAVSLSGYEIHEVGRGFVDNDIVTQYLSSFRLSNFVKVYAFKNGDTENAIPHT